MSTLHASQDQLNIIAGQSQEEKKFWMSKFPFNSQLATFPYDDCTISDSPEWIRRPFVLSEGTITAVRRLSRDSLKGINMVLLSGLAATLWKYSRQDNVVIGIPIYDQHLPASALINTALPIIIDFGPDTSFRTLLTTVREQVGLATQHQNYPLRTLMGLPGKKSPFRDDQQLFDVGMAVSPLHNESYLADFPHHIRFMIDVTTDTLVLEIAYRRNFYRESTIAQIAGHFDSLLTRMIGEIDSPISRTGILDATETEQLKHRLDRTDSDYPAEDTIPAIFRRRVAESPTSVALIAGEEQLTYGALDDRSDSIAAWLYSRHVKRNTIVGVMAEPSPVMITAILGIMKSGGAYLPIDPSLPPDQILHLIRDSGIQHLIITDSCAGTIQFDGHRLVIDRDTPPAPLQTEELPVTHPSDLACVIYTSMTATPAKGVMLSHANWVRLFFHKQPLFNFGPEDTWLLFHPLPFASSLWEVFGALLFGGRLVIAPPSVTNDPVALLGLLSREKITVLDQTPSAFHLLHRERRTAPSHNLHLRYLTLSGEPLKPASLRNWSLQFPQTQLVNRYGTTETTIYASGKNIGPGETAGYDSPLGTALPTVEILLLDPSGGLVPDGVPGEIVVGGEGLAIGYLNDPEGTASRFIPHPFKKGKRVYRTGDCARFRAGGELEYVGRLDNQVQIGSHKINPVEIENRLSQHEGIHDAVVIARQTEDGQTFLCAYWTGSQSLNSSDLNAFLQNQLPSWMIPGRFIEMSSLPLTQDHRIDRSALPRLSRLDREMYIAPRDQTEEEMLKIWQQTMQLDDFGIRDNYFNLGGDSIGAIRLVSNINLHFKSNFRINDLYSNDTAEKIAAKLKDAQPTGKQKDKIQAGKQLSEFREIVRHQPGLPIHEGIEDIFPMSDIQKGMTYYSTAQSDRTLYHEQVVIEIKYLDLDMPRFRKALSLMVGKHPIFRSCFWMEHFAHIVCRNIAPEVPYIDIAGIGPAQQKQRITTFLDEGKQRPFDLEKPPLWRMTVFQLDTHFHILVFELHHAILDGWSQASFFTELNNTYLQLKDQPGFVPAGLNITWKDFITHEIINKNNEATIRYWKKELQDYRRVDFIEFPPKGALDIRTIDEHLGNDLYRQLEAAAQLHSTTIKHLCFAAYAFAIYALSYESDLVVGITTNTRPALADGERLLGCFLNTIPVRLDFPADITWTGLIRWIDRRLVELTRYDRVSLATIMNFTGERSGERNPFFDTKFNYIDFHVIRQLKEDVAGDNTDSLGIGNFVAENTLFDFHINNTWHSLEVSLIYSAHAVQPALAEKAFAYFSKALNLIVAEPGRKATKETLFSPDETASLSRFNATTQDYGPPQTILDSLSEQVRSRPDAVALVFEDEALTFSAVNDLSAQLAARIAENAPRVPIVPVLLPRSLDLVIAITAILRSGRAFLPLDTTQPPVRLRYFLEDSAADIIVTSQQSRSLIPEGYTAIYADAISESTPQATFEHSAMPEGAAYLIYTSGSTGNPKAVIVEHQPLVNRLRWMQEQYRINAADTILQKTPSIFDVSIWELCLWMLTGSRLCLLPPGLEKDPVELIEAINRHKIHILHFVPSMLTHFSDALSGYDKPVRSVRQIFASGEALEPNHAAGLLSLRDQFQGRLSNLYGPTEACIDVTWFDVRQPVPDKIPIGYPIQNLRIHILDSQLQVQPIGVEGELCIAGAGLGRGYLNKIDLTASRFVIQPSTGERLYRTGDRAKWSEEGQIIYLGRKDDQVKIRGIRIELGEIEHQLLEIANVKAAVVLVKKDAYGDAALYAFFVGAIPIAQQQIKDHLAKRLPVYMIPSKIIQIGMMPVTRNGKLDKKALLSLEISPVRQSKTELPSSAMEKQLAQIWSEVLNKKDIGLDEELFSVGGDSFTAVSILEKLKAIIPVEIHIKNIFIHPTIRSFAAYLASINQ